MKQAIISIALIILIGTMIVSAYTPIDYKAKCYWTREGQSTENSFRPQREFQGIYGRLSDGSITCFSPSGKHHTTTNNPPTEEPCTPTTNEVCEEATCHQEQTTCRFWNYDTIWYKNHCNSKLPCRNDCKCTSHNHQNCHSEQVKDGCKTWNYKTVCGEPVCHTETINSCTD
jgi:hypothetical protein